MTKSTLHNVLYLVILKICGGRGKFCSPKRKISPVTPTFISFSKRLFKSLWNKTKTLRLLLLDFKSTP